MIAFANANSVYIAFAVTAVVELYFFMMQRSALEISRATGIAPAQGRLMLPLWYLFCWPIRLIKWAAVIQIGFWHGWIAAVILLAATFLSSIVVPIPHRQFIPIFRRKLEKEIAANALNNVYVNLYGLLSEASKDSRFR